MHQSLCATSSSCCFELTHHLVDELLHLSKSIQLSPRCEEGQLRQAELGRRNPKGLRHAAKSMLLLFRFRAERMRLQKRYIHRLLEVVEGRILIEDLDRVINCGNLNEAILHTRLELGVCLRAFFLQVGEECTIERQLRLCVLQLLEGSG